MSTVAPRKIILKCGLSLGDIVMLTAAVRDLHLHAPGVFVTDVRTPYPALWENNPNITPLDEMDRSVEVLKCEYPLIHRSNDEPYHVIHGFIQFLNDKLGLSMRPTEFKGDIFISDAEKSWFSQIHELSGEDIPFWIVVAGGKEDVTIKWWDTKRYQEVVDHFRGKIQFVQVGQRFDHHPRLKGVVDLCGHTDVRQLIRLVYHSQGVLCPVTSLMHLAAAVEVKGGRPQNRPCVVIAGGREPAHWEAYPHHQFIHTGGALLCCDHGGCWKSRTVPLRDGDELDQPENLCVDVVGKLPRCMDMIKPEDAIRRIELYFHGGAVRFLTESQSRSGESAMQVAVEANAKQHHLDFSTFKAAAKRFITSTPEYPGGHEGRGIVICGGGNRYFPSAWVCINMLRHLGCKLPIQLWHIGKEEMSDEMVALVHPLGVECVDALEVRKTKSMRILHGWECKAYAIRHSPFQELILLDADNVPVVNPEILFETPEYKETGAIFWPDCGKLHVDAMIWQVCGLAGRNEMAFESGQIVLDKARCWKELELTTWMNAHSDFYYCLVYGDKDTFHLAWRMTGREYSMTSTPLNVYNGILIQHDFQGRRIFQHRCFHKYEIGPNNARFENILYQEECLQYLDELKTKWKGL